jgi:hypothetical protein
MSQMTITKSELTKKCLIAVTALTTFAVIGAAAVAQNMQGPGAPNFGASSNPQTGGQTGGTSNIQTARPTNPNAGQGTLYNYAPGPGNNQAQPQQRRGTTGYKH